MKMFLAENNGKQNCI